MEKKRSKRILRIVAAGVTLLSIYLFAPWQFALYYLTPLPSSIDKQVAQATEQAIDGIIVYVDKKGASPEVYTSGWHSRKDKIQAKKDAYFKIGSIAKLYDALAVAKLASNKVLDLDKTLTHYLPRLSQRITHADKITLRMLVKHQSGLANYTDQAEFDWVKSWSFEQALSLIRDKPAEFSPGSDYGYSNTNYLLLRHIMEKVLGTPHTDFIKASILNKLALKNTYFSVSDIDQTRLMSGYYVGYDDDFKSLDQGYVATIADVGQFIRALNDGSVFDSETEKQLYDDLYVYHHTGWVLGYNSIARYHPEIDTVLVQFVNTTGKDTVLLNTIIYNRLLRILNAH